jgi:hypothetical protein
MPAMQTAESIIFILFTWLQLLREFNDRGSSQYLLPPESVALPLF